jgi:hypothetical protein
MKVLLTLFPVHFRNVPLFAFAVGASLFNNLTSNFSLAKAAESVYVFMDLQANVQGISVERNIAEHTIPGREGEVWQDMGGKAAPITISGKWIYENQPDDEIQRLIEAANMIKGFNVGWNWLRVQMMYSLARFNAPMILASNLFVGPVILKKFDASEVGGQPNVYNYSLQLKEFNPTLSLLGNIALTGIQLLSGAADLGSGVVRGF